MRRIPWYFGMISRHAPTQKTNIASNFRIQKYRQADKRKGNQTQRYADRHTSKGRTNSSYFPWPGRQTYRQRIRGTNSHWTLFFLAWCSKETKFYLAIFLCVFFFFLGIEAKNREKEQMYLLTSVVSFFSFLAQNGWIQIMSLVWHPEDKCWHSSLFSFFFLFFFKESDSIKFYNDFKALSGTGAGSRSLAFCFRIDAQWVEWLWNRRIDY